MGETKESRKTRRKARHKEEKKLTLGDIIFRVLIVVGIFFITIIAYATYIKGIAR